MKTSTRIITAALGAILAIGAVAISGLWAEAAPAAPAAAAPATPGTLQILTWKEGRTWMVEGRYEGVAWHRTALETMRDYAGWNQWILPGIDGKDPVSAKYWEQFRSFDWQEPNHMIARLRLVLPWPIGEQPGVASMRIDESAVDTGTLRLTLETPPFGMEYAAMHFAAVPDSPEPATGRVSFRIAMRLTPLVELLINTDEFIAHLREVTASFSRNLERRCAAADQTGTGDLR